MEDWVWNMDYGIWNIEYGMWNVECGMDSARDCCSKISRCIFDAQGIGDIWDADRIEGRALARPDDSSLYITRVSGSLGTRAPSTLHRNPGCFLRVSDLCGTRGRNESSPCPEMFPKRFQNGCQSGHPSPLEEPLNRLFMKMLQYQIRPCLLMFAAHLVACKINIFVI